MIPALVAVGALTACGSTGTSVDDDQLARDRCVDIAVAALNSLDISGINVKDGLSAAENTELIQLVADLQAVHPELGPGGECGDIESGDGFTKEEQGRIYVRVRPEIAEVLGAPSESKFSSVGSSIN